MSKKKRDRKKIKAVSNDTGAGHIRSDIFSFPKRILLKISCIIFLAQFAFGLFQIDLSRSPVLIGNENSHVKLLHSTVVGKTFAIDPTATDVSYYDGQYYSNKPPGYAFFAAPFYYIYTFFSGSRGLQGAFIFCKVFNAVLSALTAVAIFLLLSTLNISRGKVAFGLIGATLGTIFPTYSVLANSIPLSILLCVTSVLLFRLLDSYKKTSLPETILFFIMSFAVIVDYSNAFFLLPVFIALFVRTVKNKNLLALLAATLPICLLCYYQYRIFGNILTLSYTYYHPPPYVQFDSVAGSMSLSNVPRGFYGLLLSPSRGLFLLSPVTILGVIASWRFYKERKDLFVIALTAVTGILIMSAYIYWHGGHCVGYRHIMFSAIIFAVFSAMFVERQRIVKMAAILLLAFSCFTGVASFFIQLERPLLSLTWKAEPADIHANFYTELLLPFIRNNP